MGRRVYNLIWKTYGETETLMQKEAYKLTGFTAVISALGFLLRWIQNMNIIDKETGLAVQGAPISRLVTALILIVAAVLIGYTIYLRRYDVSVVPEEALCGHNFLFTVFGMVVVLLLAASGGMQLIQAGAMTWPVAHRLCGIGTLIGALGMLVLVTGAAQPEKAGARRVAATMLILHGALWLITVYKDAAADPVIWRFAIEILAVCSALIAFYYLAGYQFGEPKPMITIFFCYFGGFLCVMSAIDEHTLAESICYAASALMLFMWGAVLTSNLKKAGGPLKLDEEKIKE